MKLKRLKNLLEVKSSNASEDCENIWSFSFKTEFKYFKEEAQIGWRSLWRNLKKVYLKEETEAKLKSVGWRISNQDHVEGFFLIWKSIQKIIMSLSKSQKSKTLQQNSTISQQSLWRQKLLKKTEELKNLHQG